MQKDTIRFYKIHDDAELLAVAEVPLFKGVYLRGWHVIRRERDIEVLPPHKVYKDQATGEERIFSLLHFEAEETSRQWLERVKQEYLKWCERGDSLPSMS